MVNLKSYLLLATAIVFLITLYPVAACTLYSLGNVCSDSACSNCATRYDFTMTVENNFACAAGRLDNYYFYEPAIGCYQVSDTAWGSCPGSNGDTCEAKWGNLAEQCSYSFSGNWDSSESHCMSCSAKLETKYIEECTSNPNCGYDEDGNLIPKNYGKVSYTNECESGCGASSNCDDVRIVYPWGACGSNRYWCDADCTQHAPLYDADTGTYGARQDKCDCLGGQLTASDGYKGKCCGDDSGESWTSVWCCDNAGNCGEYSSCSQCPTDKPTCQDRGACCSATWYSVSGGNPCCSDSDCTGGLACDVSNHKCYEACSSNNECAAGKCCDKDPVIASVDQGSGTCNYRAGDIYKNIYLCDPPGWSSEDNTENNENFGLFDTLISWLAGFSLFS